jgi:hypothetical protein
VKIESEEELEFTQRLGDKAREANYALWNALLTGNGLILAAAAFLSSPEGVDRVLLFSIIVGAAVGSASLVGNFRSMQNFYIQLGKEYGRILEGKKVDPSTEKVVLGHARVRCRENTALALITLELILLVGMIAA